MERVCIICHDRAAAFRCVQCHKPVCDDCAFKDANGAFCSRGCAANYKSYKEADARARARKSGSLVKTLITLILLVVIAAAAYVIGAKKGWFGEETKQRVKGWLGEETTQRVEDAPRQLTGE